MMLELRKIGVLPRDEDLDYPVDEVRGLFDAHGLDVSFLEADAAPADLDLVVALGGDGTVLRAFDRFPGCPVLAINFGTVGFLTAGDRKDLAQIVQLLVDGHYVVSERLVLFCRYPGGEDLVYVRVEVEEDSGERLSLQPVMYRPRASRELVAADGTAMVDLRQ